jgi:hypothetical protein
MLLEVTFDRLMPLRANTDKALNSIPGPSSRVKTMLVFGTKLTNISSVHGQKRHINAY